MLLWKCLTILIFSEDILTLLLMFCMHLKSCCGQGQDEPAASQSLDVSVPWALPCFSGLSAHTYHSCQGIDAVFSLPRSRLVGRSVAGLAAWLSFLKPDWTPHVRCPWHFWLLASATSELRMPLVSFLPNCLLECFQLWFPSIHLLSFFFFLLGIPCSFWSMEDISYFVDDISLKKSFSFCDFYEFELGRSL